MEIAIGHVKVDGCGVQPRTALELLDLDEVPLPTFEQKGRERVAESVHGHAARRDFAPVKDGLPYARHAGGVDAVAVRGRQE